MLQFIFSVPEEMFSSLGDTQFPRAQLPFLSFHVLSVFVCHSARFHRSKQLLLQVKEPTFLKLRLYD